MNRSHLTAIAAIAMLLAGVGYVIIEAVVASAWTNPPYNYVYDHIPDLGNSSCGPFQGRFVCSPLYGLMNAIFIVNGVLFGVAGVLMSRLLEGAPRAVVFALALIYPVGLCMTAIFNQYAGMPANVEVLNITGVFLGGLAGNTIAVIAGSQRKHLPLPSWLGALGVALCCAGIIVGIGSFAGVATSPLQAVPPGIRDRAAIYPLILWQILTGLTLLRVWRGRRSEALTESRSIAVDDGRVPWKVFVSAYCVPVMILTGFALFATVPMVILLVSIFRNVRSRVLRWLAVLLGVVYAIPYAIYKLRLDPASSLSKDMGPIFAVLIVVAGVAFIVAIHIVSRRGSRSLSTPEYP